MATYITENGSVFYENVPEEKRELFPNSIKFTIEDKTKLDSLPDVSDNDGLYLIAQDDDTLTLTEYNPTIPEIVHGETSGTTHADMAYVQLLLDNSPISKNDYNVISCYALDENKTTCLIPWVSPGNNYWYVTAINYTNFSLYKNQAISIKYALEKLV